MAHHIICEAKIVIINELLRDKYLFFLYMFVIRTTFMWMICLTFRFFR